MKDMPYRDELLAAVARADAAEAELAAERRMHSADRVRVRELEAELREFRLGGGRSPGTLVLLMLGVEFLAVVAVTVGFLTVR
jgi:hypothetical protein